MSQELTVGWPLAPEQVLERQASDGAGMALPLHAALRCVTLGWAVVDCLT